MAFVFIMNRGEVVHSVNHLFFISFFNTWRTWLKRSLGGGFV